MQCAVMPFGRGVVRPGCIAVHRLPPLGRETLIFESALALRRVHLVAIVLAQILAPPGPRRDPTVIDGRLVFRDVAHHHWRANLAFVVGQFVVRQHRHAVFIDHALAVEAIACPHSPASFALLSRCSRSNSAFSCRASLSAIAFSRRLEMSSSLISRLVWMS